MYHADQLFLLFALGSQFDQLIKLALTDLGFLCVVADPAVTTADDVRQLNPAGIILSGGPASVHSEPPPFDRAIFDLGIPVLGICLGFQMWVQHLGAEVRLATVGEFGERSLRLTKPSPLLGVVSGQTVLQSHGDQVCPSACLEVLASTPDAPVAAARAGHLWGVQFHPEVSHTEEGRQILENFCAEICGVGERFPARDLAEQKISELTRLLAGKRVLLALSGGSDSSTVAYLLREVARRVSVQMRAVYLKGLDRESDEAAIQRHFSGQDWLELRVCDATADFLLALSLKQTMPGKRRAMRAKYQALLQTEVAAFGADFIAQGTLYTDISESGGGHESGARKARIKQHHNVGLEFSCPELTPLADCVKDGGRLIGQAIGVPEGLLARHPFPGPGLAVRIVGLVTAEKLAIIRRADAIFTEELIAADLYHTVWQAGVTLLDEESKVTCSKGDDAGEGWTLVVWAFTSVNGFTAQAFYPPESFVRRVDRRLTSEISAIGAVVLNLTGKPPRTIEWG